MDCIILVGNRDDYREILEEKNKAFLKIGDRTILHLLLEELRPLKEIDRLLLVGPKERLDRHLENLLGDSFPFPILVFEQKKDLLENVLSVITATNDSNQPDRHVLILPSDIPLASSAEIRQFIHRCDMDEADYITGLTTAQALFHFYPEEGKPGVRMQYFYLNSGKYRVNNMHMVRPGAVVNMDYIRRIYGLRYQKKLCNALRLILEVLKTGVGPGAVLYYVAIRACGRLNEWGWHRLAGLIQHRLKASVGEAYISRILAARFRLVVTHFGGSAIDVDNDRDYETVAQRHAEWMGLIRDLAADSTTFEKEPITP